MAGIDRGLTPQVLTDKWSDMDFRLDLPGTNTSDNNELSREVRDQSWNAFAYPLDLKIYSWGTYSFSSYTYSLEILSIFWKRLTKFCIRKLFHGECFR